MKIKNEEDVLNFIKKLHASPVGMQAREIRLAMENLELDQMYYEQKENGQGVMRCDVCLAHLRARLDELNRDKS